MTLEELVGGSDSVARSFLTQTYPALAHAVSRPVYLAAILYWAIYGIRLYRGHDPAHVGGVLVRLLMTFMIFAALNWGGLAGQIYGIFTSSMESAGATIMGGKPTAKMLDALWNNVGSVAALLQDAGWKAVGVVITGYGLFLLNCLLFVVALVNLTLARFGLAITMVLLPIFIGFFFFEQTRQWGMNWISKMLNFCLIYILTIAVVRFGFLAFGDVVQTAAAAATVKDAANVTAPAIAYMYVVEGVLIVFMLQVRGWAAALSGGVAVHGMSTVIGAARMFRGR